MVDPRDVALGWVHGRFPVPAAPVGALGTAREELGAVSASELPVKNFDNLSVGDAVKAVKGLTEAHDIRVVIAYEEAHKTRANVVSAAQTQLASLAKEAVGVDA